MSERAWFLGLLKRIKSAGPFESERLARQLSERVQCRKVAAAPLLQLNEELQQRYMHDPLVKRALDLHRAGELTYYQALELAVVNLSVERGQLFDEVVQNAQEEHPVYYWPEGGEPKRIPPFPDAWRCGTCRWWENDEEAFEVTNRKQCLRMTEGESPAVEAYQGVGLWTLPEFGCIQWEPKG